ncbi:MAG: ORF6N domain-containing protein [Chitinophagaceae bacterium]|jgi:phage regulator Rha-like protein|nr:ORF6N domain-containing protein [Chitinophagaceae bacterium]
MTPKTQQIHKGEITFHDVQDKIICIQNKNVLLDSDVAVLYGVETMRINEAVKNNPDKFPEGYILELSKEEKAEVIENFDNPKIKFSPALPKAFTEKGLYMLATILKSQKATDTTIAIVEAFDKMRELSNTVAELIKSPEDTQKQAVVMQKSSEILSDMVTKEVQTTGTETSFEINLFSAVKIKHTIKKERKK